jgi:hypothetical protein
MFKSINDRPPEENDHSHLPVSATLPPPDLPQTDQDNTSPTARPEELQSALYLYIAPLQQHSDDSRTITAPPIPSDALVFAPLPYESTRSSDSEREGRAAIAPHVASTKLSLQTEPGRSQRDQTEQKTVLGWLASRVALYGTAELTGSATAAIGIGIASAVYPHSAAVGIIGTLSENLGLYSVLLYSAMRDATRQLEKEGRSHTWKSRFDVGTKLVAQFGVAEVFDSLLFRPFLMSSGSAVGWFLGEHLLGQGFMAMAAGALGCKLVADVIYWSMVEATGAVITKAEERK